MPKSFSSRGELFFLIAFIFLKVFAPEPVYAIQIHGGTEALVAHQIGHILFLLGALSILVRIYRGRWQGPGWNEFKYFLWLIILWNGVTFLGHFLSEVERFHYATAADGRILGLYAVRVIDYVFYFCKLDHLLLFPAMLYLFFALRRWIRSS